VPDPELSIAEGALVPWSVGNSTYYESVIQAIADRYEIDVDKPWRELTEEQQNLFLYGTDGDKVMSRTETGWAAGAPTCWPSRASSRVSSAATRRPTRRASASGSRST
jgi:excinuclease UvrABC ATPase subunit